MSSQQTLLPRTRTRQGSRRNEYWKSVRKRVRPVILWGSIVNLLLICIVWLLLQFVSERWWVGTTLVYLPRSLYVVGGILLLPCAMLWQRNVIAVNLISLFMVTVPIMGFNAQLPSFSRVRNVPGGFIRVASCNVQQFEPAFASVISELNTMLPDIVIFQEARGSNPLVDARFGEDWHRHQIDEYFVASRFPLRMIAQFHSAPFQRVAAVVYEVDHPHRPFRLFNIHQTSPRHGLSRLRLSRLFETSRELNRQTADRESEAVALRAFLEEHRGGQPVLLAGDFNMPDDSHLFRSCWGEFRNSFELCGLGYGYTAPCDNASFWPAGTPWSRVDHILTSDDWNVRKCWVGIGNGSDHRLIAAIVSQE